MKNEKKIKIIGNKKFTSEIIKKIDDFSEITEISLCGNINRIEVSGEVQPKALLHKCCLIGNSIFWMLSGEFTDIYNIERLLEIQSHALDESDYSLVKLINKLIMEVELYKKSETVHYYPTSLQVEHSTICNAKCIMCTHYFTKNYGRSFINYKVIRKLEHILPYIDKILLHGVGEAFLNPNIKEYLMMYAKYGVKVSCITNLSYMNEELADAVGKTFDYITISCDGASAETFEKIRRGISFERFCENIRLFHRCSPNVEMRFNVVCMRQNIREMPDIIKLASELGVKAIGISGLISQSILDNCKDEIRLYPKTASYYLHLAEKKAAELNIRLLQYPRYVYDIKNELSVEEEEKLISAIPFSHPAEFEDKLYKKYRKLDVIKPVVPADISEYAVESGCACTGICDYFVESNFVNINGDITTCCIDGIHILGNLNEYDFDIIYNSDVMQKLRNLFFSGKLPKYCAGCMFLKDCTKTERINIDRKNDNFWTNKFSDLIEKAVDDVKE